VILLARHGETDDNVPPQRVQGWIDSPLNDRGREQARELALAVTERGIATVHSSHLARARETAEIVARELGLDVRTGKEVFRHDGGGFSPPLSDGKTLYLTGYATELALRPRKKAPKGGRSGHRARGKSQAP